MVKWYGVFRRLPAQWNEGPIAIQEFAQGEPPARAFRGFEALYLNPEEAENYEVKEVNVSW